MDEKGRRHRCILVGRMKITQSVVNRQRSNTLRLSRHWYDAMMGMGTATPSDLPGHVERGCMDVEVEMMPSDITVKSGDHLENNIRLQDLMFLAAMRTPEESRNHVMVAGYCQYAQTLLALVFEFADNELANLFIRDYHTYCTLAVTRREDPKPKLPSRPASLVLPKHLSLSGTRDAPADFQEDPSEAPPSGVWKPPVPPRNRAQCKDKPPIPPRNSVVEQISPISATAKPPLPPRGSDNLRNSSHTTSKSPPPLPPRVSEMGKNCDVAAISTGSSFKSLKFKSLLKKGRTGEEAQKGPSKPKKGIFSFRRKVVQYENVMLQVEEKTNTVNLNEDSLSDDSKFSDYESIDESYDYSEDFYESLGLSIEDSERIFRCDTTHHAENNTSSQKESIFHFLKDEYDYQTCLRCITAARTLSPELHRLLGRAEALEHLHNDLYRELHSSHDSYSSIAQAFLSRREQLESYKYHLMNGPRIKEELAKVPESDLRDHPDLEETLRTSWKRPHFYFMNLEKFLSSVPIDDRDIMQEAVTMLKELNRLGDSGIIIDGVKGCPFDLHIKAPLLLHSSFKIKGPGMQKKDYRVLLFGEMLVITLPEGWVYRYQCSLRMDQLLPICQKPEQAASFAVVVRDGGKKEKNYVFTAPNENTKQKWDDEIKRLTKNIANEVKREAEKRFGAMPVV
ncbi:uncharacterized protein LOC125031840 [Penaeus chinensis]|uniref:uncharacterized protein LOC125031840 n=1 Tax=Penaeus chinensis TaxID=139456 RepID=UPI001FB82A7D|nr:uncharacterized protein LOC125031840 [Penaeus chinensis]